MARMVPPLVGPEVSSAGEREVFLRLRDDAGTGSWTVLHSLDIAQHESQTAGEADFVVLVPGVGVLCLEVKGCSGSSLRRENGVWYYGVGDRGDRRGPFRQASEAMHSLRRRLLARQPDLARIHFCSGVVFPFARFSEESPEWHPWQVVDSVALRSAPIHERLLALLASSRAHLGAAARAPLLDEGRPSAADCDSMLRILRPEFELPADPKARRAALEGELGRFIDEQFVALDAMADNPRTLFVGPAGSGKTFLALEAVRRAKGAGRSVLFVCFNRLLGDWLSERTAHLSPGVTTRTLHQHLLAVAELSQAPVDCPHEFWTSRLPELACERLLNGRDGERWVYDELVVDEAQDVFQPPYLDALDLSLRGGLAAGHWRIFGDFENQALFGVSSMVPEEFRRRRGGGAPIYRLRVNCRNTPLVAEYAQLLSALTPRYQRVLRPDDGIQPTLRFHRTSEEQALHLAESLDSLAREGFAADEIVVLSPRAEGACSTLLGATQWASRVRPMVRWRRSHFVGYCTVQAFKGLEAPAVVVTDIETISTPASRALLYVAATRPLQRLVVLAHDRVRSEAVGILLRPASAPSEVQRP